MSAVLKVTWYTTNTKLRFFLLNLMLHVKYLYVFPNQTTLYTQKHLWSKLKFFSWVFFGRISNMADGSKNIANNNEIKPFFYLMFLNLCDFNLYSSSSI